MLCKICEGTIPVPEGESVLHICTDCLNLKDLTGDDLRTQVRQQAVSKLAGVTVYKAKNVPEKSAPVVTTPVVEAPKPAPKKKAPSIAKDAVAAVKRKPAAKKKPAPKPVAKKVPAKKAAPKRKPNAVKRIVKKKK